MLKWLRRVSTTMKTTTTLTPMSKIDVERHVIYAKLYAFFCLFILIFHTRNFIFYSHSLSLSLGALFFRSIAHSGIQLACIYKIHSNNCSLVIVYIVVVVRFFSSLVWPLSSPILNHEVFSRVFLSGSYRKCSPENRCDKKVERKKLFSEYFFFSIRHLNSIQCVRYSFFFHVCYRVSFSRLWFPFIYFKFNPSLVENAENLNSASNGEGQTWARPCLCVCVCIYSGAFNSYSSMPPENIHTIRQTNTQQKEKKRNIQRHDASFHQIYHWTSNRTIVKWYRDRKKWNTHTICVCVKHSNLWRASRFFFIKLLNLYIFMRYEMTTENTHTQS